VIEKKMHICIWKPFISTAFDLKEWLGKKEVNKLEKADMARRETIILFYRELKSRIRFRFFDKQSELQKHQRRFQKRQSKIKVKK
jgi:hypothetical protein